MLGVMRVKTAGLERQSVKYLYSYQTSTKNPSFGKQQNKIT
jgi:hypothetical protein